MIYVSLHINPHMLLKQHFLICVNNTPSKRQGPPKKGCNISHKKPFFEFGVRAVEETTKTLETNATALLGSIQLVQCNSLFLKMPCTSKKGPKVSQLQLS